MIDESLLPRIKGVLADVFNVKPEHLELNSSPDTVETWDSINHLNMVIALEQEFGIQLAAEEIEQAFSVEAINDLIGKKRAELDTVGR